MEFERKKFLKVFAGLLIAVGLVVGSIYYVEELADTEISITGSDVDVQVMDFRITDLSSGEDFTETNSTTMTVNNIDEPYLTFDSNFEDSEDFDNLKATITVDNEKSKTLDLKDGETWTLYTLDESYGYGYGLSGSYPVEVTIDGSVDDVKSSAAHDFLINVSVGSYE